MPFEWLTVPTLIDQLLDIAKTGSGLLPRRLNAAVSARWTYEQDKHRFAFDVEIKNGESLPITLDTIAITRPAGGALRIDPPVLIWTLEDGREEPRERGLGPATSVLNIELEISPGERGNFSFVFVPPEQWAGGKFRAVIRSTVHGPKEARHRIVISRELSQRETADKPRHAPEWLSVTDAMERFCDPQFIGARNKRRGELASALSSLNELERRTRAIESNFSWARQTALQLEHRAIQAKSQSRSLFYDATERSLRDIDAALWGVLLEGLARSDLVAQGYAEPYKPGASPVTIRSSEWSILALNSEGVVTRKGGQTPIYTEVQIAAAGGNKHVRLLSQRKMPPIIGTMLEPGVMPYAAVETRGERVLSTARIGIRNFGGAALSNCKVYVEDIQPTPPLPGGLPILLEGSGFTLRHDDPEKLVDIATHWSHVDKFRFAAPFAGGFAETLGYIDDSQPRELTIKIVATECQRRAKFRLGTDRSAKVLHLEFMGFLD